MKFNFEKIKTNNLYYIIAEAGVNHDCSLKKAKKMIYLAKKSGADAIKFQTYKSEKLVLPNSKAYWDTSKEKINNQSKLFSKYDKFNFDDYRKLYSYCKSLKIDFLSTPFDIEAVKFLNNFVNVFKISSSDITNYPLLDEISKTKKPVLLSTGASNISEIKNALKILKKGTKKITIMHCILNYPTLNKDANLGMINSLKKNFPNYLIGYSDHTVPDKDMKVLTTAFILGARVIEKHFTLDKKKKGNDHYHSMDFIDVKKLKINLEEITRLIGDVSKIKSPIRSEFKSRRFARRCIASRIDIKKNTKLSKINLITLRPNIGIPAENWKKILGKKINRNIKAYYPIKKKDLKF